LISNPQRLKELVSHEKRLANKRLLVMRKRKRVGGVERTDRSSPGFGGKNNQQSK